VSDELLPLYNRELAFIRRQGAEFALANPRIAARLRLSAEGSDDPHVARMIEAFAYLNARTRHKIEDEFPEVTDAMLGVLYPHYLAPIPSMSVVEFLLDRAQGEMTTGYAIPRGSMLETEPINGAPCRFRTAYPVTVWPFEVAAAAVRPQPFVAPAAPFSAGSVAVIAIELASFSAKAQFGKLAPDRLRFFLHGQPQHVYPLYEMLFQNVVGVAVARSPGDPRAAFLTPGAIEPVGFNPEEGLLPNSPRQFGGYHRLTEFFTFPHKYLFFDVVGLRSAIAEDHPGRLFLYLFLDRSLAQVEQNVSAETFRLGATPVVNLFTLRAEPIKVTHRESEYRVVPDVRRPAAHEVYSIDRVTATSPQGDEMEYLPFYSFKHGTVGRGQQTFWHASRRQAGSSGGKTDPGTEVYVALVDLGFNPAAPAEWTLHVDAHCLNRDLPHRLPFGPDEPFLQLPEGGPIGRIRALLPFTPTYRPALRHGARWRLISHLCLNHLSISDEAEAADALKEILRLYDLADSPATRSIIDGVVQVASRRVTGRAGGGGPAGVCRGVQVRVKFDETRFEGQGLFLFASVLERFLALYTNVNSFSQLVAVAARGDREIKKWPPRAGDRPLL
jgi:type VI secretion system protein ImpG